jgi:hypothetical protein
MAFFRGISVFGGTFLATGVLTTGSPIVLDVGKVYALPLRFFPSSFIQVLQSLHPRHSYGYTRLLSVFLTFFRSQPIFSRFFTAL